MKKIHLCLIVVSMIGVNANCFSAKLCGEISATSTWTGGVFSVVNDSGTTVATTDFILSGNQGCTHLFKAGTYVIRFTGFENTSHDVVPFNGVYGCLTAPYIFDEGTAMTVVFNHGRHPFNGNVFCGPSVD